MVKKISTSKDDDDSETIDLEDHGIFLLNGEFDYDCANDVITWLLESSLKKKKPDHLTLIINSHGGALHCCFAIIDMMRASKIPVHTVGLGQISSCGLLTFMSGEKGHRILTPNTSIMSHEWSDGFEGKAHEFVAMQKENELTSKRILNQYQRCTGLDIDMIKAKLLPPHDVYLSAEEALDLGICDAIRLF